MVIETVGAWLRKRRVVVDLSQGQLAKHLRVTASDVAAVEEGHRAFSGWLLWYWLRAAWLTACPPEPLMEELDAQIAELVAQAPEFAEPLAQAREVNKNHPRELGNMLRYARWLLAEKESQHRGRTE